MILLIAGSPCPGYAQSLSHGSSVPTAPPAPQPYRPPAPARTPRHTAVRPHPKAISKHTPPPRHAAARPAAPQYVAPAAPRYVAPAPPRYVAPVAPPYVAPVVSQPATGQPVTIPVILSLTGSAAFIGAAESATIRALESFTNRSGGINGRPVRFEISDDQTNPQVAVQDANADIGHSPVVMGGSLTATCNAIAPMLASGSIDWCLSPALNPSSGSSVFTTSTSIQDNVNATVRFFREKGWTRIGDTGDDRRHGTSKRRGH